MKKKGSIGAIVLAIIIVIGLVCVFKLYTRIPAGYAGVVYDIRTGITDKTLNQGGHVVSPMKDVTLFSVGIEQSYLTSTNDGDSPKDDSFEVSTSDGKKVRVDLAFTYGFDHERLPSTFVNFKGASGVEIRDSFIKPKMMAWTREVTSKHTVIDIIGDKQSFINDEITEYTKMKFDKYGIVVDSVSLVDVRIDDETSKAIQKKVTAQQELELAKIQQNTDRVNAEKEKEVALIQAEQEKESAAIKAEQAKIKAAGEADAIRLKAEAEADAIFVKAKAEAEANDMIAKTLTPELIDNNKVEKWSGEYPIVFSGDSDSMILNMNDLAGLRNPEEE